MIRLIVTGLLAFAGATTGVAGEAENIRIVREMIEAVDRHDYDALDAIVAADLVRHSGATPGVSVRNLGQFKQLLEADAVAWPDAEQEIDIIFASGDWVAVRARFIGTQTGPLGPFPPSGKRMEVSFMGILRVENGKIAEIWIEWNHLNALTQLGHYPPAGGGSSD